MIFANKMIKAEFPDAQGLIRYHDEEEWECKPEYAHRVGELGIESIKKAGEYLQLNVPITGEYKVGKTWADVH
jgi:DNA polymerase I-like protein with 3'-5' exonuclease and polymerase domains